MLKCHEEALERLLKVIATEGLLRSEGGGRYALTSLGALLKEDQQGKLAAFIGAPFSWNPWSKLTDAVRSGDSAFEQHHGSSLFDYLENHPKEASLYHAAIDAFTRREATAINAAFDFSGVRRLVDVGGGRGTLLLSILEAWPQIEGLLFDRTAAVRSARAQIEQAQLGARCSVIEGDFFEAVPGNVDACIVKHVIHNWNDENAVTILRRCAEALNPGGVVLVIDGLLLPGTRREGTRLLDLEMLALCGPGKERSKPDMRRLLSAAGLRLEKSVALMNATRLMVAKPR